MQANLIPKSIYKNAGKVFLVIKARPGSKKEGITGKNKNKINILKKKFQMSILEFALKLLLLKEKQI